MQFHYWLGIFQIDPKIIMVEWKRPWIAKVVLWKINGGPSWGIVVDTKTLWSYDNKDSRSGEGWMNRPARQKKIPYLVSNLALTEVSLPINREDMDSSINSAGTVGSLEKKKSTFLCYFSPRLQTCMKSYKTFRRKPARILLWHQGREAVLRIKKSTNDTGEVWSFERISVNPASQMRPWTKRQATERDNISAIPVSDKGWIHTV